MESVKFRTPAQLRIGVRESTVVLFSLDKPVEFITGSGYKLSAPIDTANIKTLVEGPKASHKDVLVGSIGAINLGALRIAWEKRLSTVTMVKIN